MNVTTDKDKSYLRLEGEMTIAKAAKLKDALARAIDSGKTVVIDIDRVTGVDLSFLQLLCSAHRTAANQGKKLTISNPGLPVYAEARKTAGFHYTKPCRHVASNGCLWVGGGE